MNRRFEIFAASIAEVYRCVQKIKRAEMRKYGLRGNHAMCLYYLGGNPQGLTAAQLTAFCKEDKAAVSRTLAELEERGLTLHEQTDGKRDYRCRHTLTDQGRAVTTQLNRKIDEALEEGGRGLAEEERAAFYRSLEIIRKNLQKMAGE